MSDGLILQKSHRVYFIVNPHSAQSVSPLPTRNRTPSSPPFDLSLLPSSIHRSQASPPQKGDESSDPASARPDLVAERTETLDPVVLKPHPPRSNTCWAAVEAPASRGSAFLAMADDPYDVGKEPKQQMKAVIEWSSNPVHKSRLQ